MRLQTGKPARRFRRAALAAGLAAIALGLLVGAAGWAHAQPTPVPPVGPDVTPAPGTGTVEPIDNPAGVPDLSKVLPAAQDRRGMAATLQIVLLLTVLSLAPSILVLMTSFTRIVIVLSLLRRALATQQLPPNQVIIGLSLFLTFMVMAPVFQQVNEQAIGPYLEGRIDQTAALQRGAGPIRGFMIGQIREYGNTEDVNLFLRNQGVEAKTWGEVPISALVPAFVISELKTAFMMGFRIYLPFLVIDVVIASVLVSMGMMMLPPVLISLPFKLLLFVLVDGWHLVVGSMINSFVTGTAA